LHDDGRHSDLCQSPPHGEDVCGLKTREEFKDSLDDAMPAGDEEQGGCITHPSPPQPLPGDVSDDESDDDDNGSGSLGDRAAGASLSEPDGCWSWARESDELSRVMADGRSLHGFVEGNLSFPPSFRWVRGARADYDKAGIQAFRGCYTLHKEVCGGAGGLLTLQVWGRARTSRKVPETSSPFSCGEEWSVTV
jgi:hypothetical protein